MAFVATSAPQGWKLGRWSEKSQTAWQEEKLDNPQIVYQYQVVKGPSMPGSKTVRLKMKDQNTEVLLLDSSAQVFVNGNYFGEYAGEWQNGSKRQSAAAPRASTSKQAAAAPEPAAAPAPAARRQSGSKPQPDSQLEQTMTPEQASPPAKKAAPAGGGAPYSSPISAGVSSPLSRSEFQPWQAPESNRAGKAPDLDKSDASMQKLIAAAKNGDVGQVKQLLASGIDPDGPAKDGQTPLMAAAKGGHIPVCEALLEACADPTIGKGDETPLTIAFQKGNQELLKVLFAGSFNTLNNKVGPTSINIQDSGLRSESEVPDNAQFELRQITAKISSNAAREKPDSPSGKYGNYQHLTAKADMEDKDSDYLRTESVRHAMKSLTKTTRAGGLAKDSVL